MPEKPKALSPSIASTGCPVSTAAAIAEPIPIPITPQVPTSSRFLGLYISITVLAKSRVFAPSLTSTESGRSLIIFFKAPSAPWKSIGLLSFSSLGDILATLVSTLSFTSSVHSDGGLGHSSPIPSRSDLTQEPISPTTGAAISTLLSISFGSISTWINFLA